MTGNRRIAARSLVEVLERRAEEDLPGRGYTFLAEGSGEEQSLSFAGLARRARAVAGWLQGNRLAGERVVLLFPPGLDFIVAYFGCLYAGAVAVPCYPPRPHQRADRLTEILADAGAGAVLLTSALAGKLAAWSEENSALRELRSLAVDEIDDGWAEVWTHPRAGPETLAFLQYTSGSTATPKGVMVSHGNLLHNQEVMRAACGQSESSVVVSWLPLYHDMGLIGGVLHPLYLGARCILFSPVAFLQRPRRWLEAITRYRATASGGPDFAFDLCVRRIGEAEREGLDLSSWEMAWNGAEPVRSETLTRFAAAFLPWGFRPTALYPCYGLAEATLFVAGGAPGRMPVVKSWNAEALAQGRAEEAQGSQQRERRLVGCGGSWLDHEVAIVDPVTRLRSPARTVGEIWVSGPSVAQGYWRQPAASVGELQAHLAEAESGPFLRTGDLGFMDGAELFVTGRLKDLIILRGRNFYPQDLERTAERAHPGVRPGCGAAFPVEIGGQESLILACEVERHPGAEPAAIIAAIRRAVGLEHEISPFEIVLLRAGSLPKTSSGKVQRRACRSAYLAGSLSVVGRGRAAEDAGELEDLAALSRERLLNAPPEDRLPLLERFVRGEVARLAHLSASQLDPGEPLVRQGLDSLAVIELGETVEARLGVGLSWTELIEGASLREIEAALLERLTEEPPGAGEAAATPRASGDCLPSYGQRALWFLCRLAPEESPYIIVAAVRVLPPFDVDALGRSLNRLVERYPALRTTFPERDGEPCREVKERMEVKVEIRQVEVDPEAVLAGLLDCAHRPFDLEHGPLLRLLVARREGGDAILVLAIHHLVTDFASLALFSRELGDLYAEERGGPMARLAPVDESYDDFVARERERLAGPEGERLWAYWREQVGGLPSLELPTDRPRAPAQTFRGASQVLRLGKHTRDEVAVWAGSEGATTFMALLAVFEALLGRYTGLEDLAVGSPSTLRGTGRGIGYFVNPLALRADLRHNPAIGTVLARARLTAIAAHAHQDLPFALIAERLQSERDPRFPPLFQVMLVWQGVRDPGEQGLASIAFGEAGVSFDIGGLSLLTVGREERASPFDLVLRLAEIEGDLLASLQYNPDLFDRPTAGRMLRHFEALLRDAVADPARPIGALSLLGPAEEHQILREWNGTAATGTVAQSLYHGFALQAARAPDRTALVWRSERLTYRELRERSRRIAADLVELGVGPEVRVGVLLARSPEMVAAILGVLAAGGAYVPLDPAYPLERLSFMLADSGARLLVTDGAGLPSGEDGPPLFCLDASGRPRDRPQVAARVVESRSEVVPENLAYVIYTSGSTGRPKGVAIEQRSAVGLVRWAIETFLPAELAGVLASTSVCFDLSIFELFVPLSAGGTILLAGTALELPGLAAAGEVTLLNTVPSTARELVLSGGLPASLLTVNLAGEPLPGELVRRLHEAGVGRVLNLYGPSEDTTYSTQALIAPGSGREPEIGRPLPGTRVSVVGRFLDLVPLGVPGELLLGGEGLARGYLGRPELTAERFLPDPFSRLPGERLYRTGDLVRQRGDGGLEFLGRLDGQVKLRGFRIELGEVEAVLATCPGVEETAVLVREGEGGDRRLVAYLVVRQEPPSGAELRDFLEGLLPGYMVPSAFVVLESFPRTPSGKLDRRELERRPLSAVEGERRKSASPRTPTEQLLAGVWSELLGVERVGVEDRFFELGGHSLLASRLASRVRSVLGVEVPLGEVFQRPRLVDLAAWIDGARRGGSREPLAPLGRVERGGPLPLSPAQERLWFVSQLDPESALYAMPGGARLTGRLSVPAFRAAWTEVVRRHETLRTRLPTVAEEPVQVVEPVGLAEEVALPLLDLQALPRASGEVELGRVSAGESRRPFDLGRGPLLRLLLVRLGGEEHAFLFNLHHIVGDGWSLGVLNREVGALYGTYVSGRSMALPDLPVQYADYAVGQRQWLTSEGLTRGLAFWRERLAGAPPLLELPTDRPRPAVESHRGGISPGGLPASLADSLVELGRREGATSFMVVLAGFACVLSRYTGEEDLIVGTPVAHRSRPELEGLVGLFVNTLALRLNVGGEVSFRACLSRVRESVLSSFVHQEVPFERLVEELSPERSLAHAPLFQVMLAFGAEERPWSVSLPGLGAAPLARHSGTAKFDLTLAIGPAEAGFAGEIEYSRDLFDPTTLARLWSHLEVLLGTAVATPEGRVSALSLLSEPERCQLFEWNETGRSAAAPGLYELFADQAERTPDRTALVWRSERLTYRELRERSRRIAADLVELGVGPEVRVGVLLARSPEMVAAILGVLAAGGAYVPLDPAYPLERLSFMLADSGARLLVTDGAGLPSGEDGPPLFRLDASGRPRDRPQVAARTVESRSEVVPENLAYVIYTSGSTGRPKGVAIEQRSAVGLVRWAIETFLPAELAGVLASTSVCFDLSIFELFVPLSAGGTILLAGTALELPGLAAAGEVTLLNTVPSAARELVLSGGLPASLLTVNLAGEPLPGELVRRLHEAGVGRVLNLYGPSEDTTYSTQALIAPGSGREPEIGRPLPGTRVSVVGRFLDLVPLGVPGELLLGGEGLARGYLGRPELTAERFLPDPFSRLPGERLYRTGDLVRQRGDGGLGFLGRLDGQVKLRGFRIELGEVEAVLATHPRVEETAVLVREGEGGDRRLVAYLVARQEPPSGAELRNFLGGLLPDYMVPSAFVVLESFPRTPSGKLDRRELERRPLSAVEGERRKSASPRTPTEQLLAGVWSELLGVERVGVEDRFFELGGHSLLASRLVSRVRSVLGVEVPLGEVFQRPRLVDLAAWIDGARRGGSHEPLAPLGRVERGGPLPLSPAQERLWFVSQLDPESALYAMPGGARLTGRLSVPAFRAAWTEVVRRHETLRTRLPTVAGEPVQVVEPAGEAGLPLLDLRALPRALGEVELGRVSAGEARQPFDLGRGPLLRLLLVRLGEEEHALLFNLHHIVGDGWSLGVLSREVGALYGAYASGRSMALLDLPVQYGDYAVGQRQWLASEGLTRGLAFWRERLAGAPPLLELPTDRPRPAVESHCGAVLPGGLPEPLAGRLIELGRREGTTPFMVVLAGFACVLSRYTGEEDLIVGTPVANRSRPEIEGLVGLFVNTLALRLNAGGEVSFRAFLSRARESVLSSFVHQEVPFERLVEELSPERSLAHSPLFQVMLAFGAEERPWSGSLPGLGTEPLARHSGTAKFDLTLAIGPAAAGLAGEIEYSRDLFDRTTLARLWGHLEVLLGTAVAAPESRVSALPLLSEPERRQLAEWNETGRSAAAPGLYELFAQQAERSTCAVALVTAEEQVSYGELARRATRLSAQLRGLGVEPEVRVAVGLERYSGLVVAILGVLAAGGAYVPLDPSYPIDRLSFMLKDSGARVLVTDGSVSVPEAGGPRVVRVDASGGLAGRIEVGVARAAIVPESLAYVIYTSGSTGLPKGVAITHRSATALVDWAAAVFGPAELGGVLASTSVCFDLSVFELFVPLSLGGTVLLVANALALPSSAARDRVSLINTVPSAMAELERLGLPAGVRTVNLAGEPLKAGLVRRLAFAEPALRVLNLYGPSEDTTYSTYTEVKEDEPGDPPIGRPIAATHGRVLGNGFEGQPIGVPGELSLAGVGLARGYLGSPERTAEKFIPDAASEEPGGRLYRTGDLVRLRATGELEFLRRLDRQVKVRGFRVEPQEIEAVLACHPGLAEVVVSVREDASGGPRLIAYGVPIAGAAPRVADLRGLATAKLPLPLVPSAFVLLESLPRTPNGKVDRRALPAPDWRGTDCAYEAPQGPLEELIAGIWGELLGEARPIGRHDSFFDLGGHSLLAARVLSRIEAIAGNRLAGVALPLRTLFERPTLAALSQAVAEARGAGSRLAPPLAPVPRGDALPASFAQERMWFLDQLEPESPAYHLALAVGFAGRLEVAVLAGALSEVVRRHEALRTTFLAVSGRPLQQIAPAGPLGVPVVDLQALSEGDRGAVSRRLGEREARRPFELSQGPLLRATLLRLGPERHRLLLVLHHIVADGWSLGVLLAEIRQLYEAFLDGLPSPCPELALQYGDFACWQRRWLTGSVLKEELDYWRERLSGAPAVLALSMDRPRQAVQEARGGALQGLLPASLAMAAGELGRGSGTTLFMILLAVFQTLLARYSGQLDIVVGSPVANRNRPEVEPLIGLFVNTLPLRADLSGAPSFRDLVAQVRETTLAAYDHRELPFEKLVEELNPVRGQAATPLFQAMFTLQNTPLSALALAGLRLEPSTLETGTAKLDLALSATEVEGGLATTLRYRRDLFEEVTAQRLLAHFHGLLSGALEMPDESVAHLPLLSAVERHQLLFESQGERVEELGEGLLHRRVSSQVERTPEAVAVVFEGASLSYREMDRQANRLATRLGRLGIGPEVRVGIFMERRLEMVVGLLAVLQAGGAYVPLDPAYPSERLRFLSEDAGTSVVLTEERLADRLPAGLPVLTAETWSEGGEGEEGNGGVASQGPTPETLAYVLYTSGTTGRPKGVMVPHRGVCNHLRWRQDEYGLTAADCLLQKGSLAFDASLWEVFWPLSVGARLIVARPGGQQDSSYLVETVAREGVTFLHAVPSLLRVLIEEPGLSTCTSLRRVTTGGEPLPMAVRERYFTRSEAELHHGYGPTEASIGVSYGECERGGEEPTVLGRPIANVEIYLLDGSREPVPLGVAGEIYLGGVALARGYLGQAALTAERFVPHGLSRAAGARLYRTGDLARRRLSGGLEFLGRIDQQVKVRGMRVELGEIEAALERHPSLAEAVVVTREMGGGDRQLLAYVVVDAHGGGLVEGEVRRFLAEQLPDHMVPSRFFVLPRLPLLPSGKVDRKALAERAEEAMSVPLGDASSEAPVGAIEEMMAALWCEVLEMPQVGRDESFFALGGHSLLATQVVSRLRRALGVELPLRQLFEAPTLRQLAAAVEEALRGGATPLPPLLGSFERSGDPPLSFAQERLWFLDRLMPGLALYHLPSALRLSGPLDRRALGRALGEIVRRHEILRSLFPEAEGRPVQRILAAAPLHLPAIDLSGLPEWSREDVLVALARDEAGRPFDLARGPLLRAVLVRLGAAEHALLLTLHHIVSDGWSTGVLVRELAAGYTAFRQGENPGLPALPIQYADFALWQRQCLTGDVLARELAYWRERLAAVPASLDLPFDRPRPAVRSQRGGHRPFELAGTLRSALSDLAIRQRATPFMVLLAAFELLLSRYSGQREICLGTPIAGRTQRETEGLIGLFGNTLALTGTVAESESFVDFLDRVREGMLGAYAHQDLPFEKLVAEIRPDRNLSQSPLFQVMFVLQNAPLPPLLLPDLVVSPMPPSISGAKFDLTLAVADRQGRLSGVVEYAVELFDDTTLTRLCAHFLALLQAIVAEPGREVGRFAMVSPAERHQSLAEWNDTASDLATSGGIPGLFAAQARRAPEQPAVIFEGLEMSYRDLDRRSNQLARRLLRLGVGAEVLVGIATERSFDMIVGLLAILKAGGGYVPLDPDYPASRLARMLEDVELPVLLTRDRLLPRLPVCRAEVLRLDADWAEVAEESDAPLASGTWQPASLAYVIFTSGSTGRPKGAMNTHGAITNRLLWMQEVYGLTERDRVLQKTPFSFDVSVWELFCPLLVGAPMVLAKPGGHRDSSYLARLIREQGVTVAHFVPSMLRYFVAEVEAGLCTSLRQVVASGEALPSALARDLEKRLAATALDNLYGPTETAVEVSAWRFRGRSGGGAARASVPIGRPIANLCLHVLDRAGQMVPVGVPGELYIGGVAVGRGYLNRPEWTAERFVPDLVAVTLGARLYRTGDLVRRLPGGEIEFLGRLDHQVKIRGVRIELGEIEAALSRQAGVVESAVTVWERDADDRRLVAYVVPVASPGATRPEERSRDLSLLMAKELPEAMVPTHFVWLDSLPLNSSGKLDRNALPLPELGATRTGLPATVPRSPVEEILAEIWANALGLDRVGVEDSFFDLGGHSLLATQVISRVRHILGVEIPLRLLFEEPTVARFAAAVEAASGARQSLRLPSIVPVPRDEALPLSFAQERFWIRHRSGTSVSNIPLGFRLKGDLDLPALERSFREILNRHEALRTAFGEIDGVPIQILLPRLDLPWTACDLSALPSPRIEEEAGAIVATTKRQVFALSRAPLFKITMIRVSPDENLLLLVQSHMITDGWSQGLLVREIVTLYGDFAARREASLPAPAVQYADFAVWQRRHLQGSALDAQRLYWRDQLRIPWPVLRLPTSIPRPEGPQGEGGWISRSLPAGLFERVRAFGVREGTSLFMTLLAAYDIFLHLHTQEEDLPITTNIANRNRIETEGLLGLFTNVLVLRTSLDGDPDGRTILRRVREVTLQAYAHQDYPFASLLEELSPGNGQAYRELFPVGFVLQNVTAPISDLPGLEVQPLGVESGMASRDFIMIAVERERGMEVGILFRADIFLRETIGQMLAQYENLLAALVSEPERRLSGFHLGKPT